MKEIYFSATLPTFSFFRPISYLPSSFLTSELTPEQKQAAKELQAMAKKEPPCDREFYNHIMEERRRRKEDREIRRKMREREEKERQERINKK